MSNSKYTTVLITDKNAETTKIYKIKKKYIENMVLYKNFLLSFFIISALIFISFIYYINNSYSQKQILKGQISKLEQKLKDKNLNKILDNLDQAEETLQKIETYLEKRHVKILTDYSDKINQENDTNLKGMGGEFYPLDSINPQYVIIKKKRAKDLYEKIQFVPMGLPYKGRLTSKFGVRKNPISGSGGEFHPGLDIAGPLGTPIKATASGVVIFSGVKGGYGKCVMIKHRYGYQTLYGHLQKTLVREGEIIKAGDVIGKLGSTGRSTGPHVHYEIIHNHKKIDPLANL